MPGADGWGTDESATGAERGAGAVARVTAPDRSRRIGGIPREPTRPAGRVSTSRVPVRRLSWLAPATAVSVAWWLSGDLRGAVIGLTHGHVGPRSALGLHLAFDLLVAVVWLARGLDRVRSMVEAWFGVYRRSYPRSLGLETA